jgi:spore coat protein U-like protein
MRRIALIAAFVFASCGAAPPALALLQSCTVSATPLSFGPYSPSSSTALSGTGTINVSCTVTLVGLLESWTIQLSTGNSGTYSSRQMSTAGQSLVYNLYTTAAHSQVWGNGTAGTGTVTDSQLLAIGTSQYPYTVYGLVNTFQDLAPGTYTDVITVTLNY